MTHGERAEKLFKDGCNCSQAVFGAYAKELGFDFDMAMKLSSSFGGGMGRMREVCGAVSAIFMVAGVKYGVGAYCTDDEKKAHYQRIQDIAARLKEINGSIICRDLLGLEGTNHTEATPTKRTETFYKKRPCAEICKIVCDVFDEMFLDKES